MPSKIDFTNHAISHRPPHSQHRNRIPFLWFRLNSTSTSHKVLIHKQPISAVRKHPSSLIFNLTLLFFFFFPFTINYDFSPKIIFFYPSDNMFIPVEENGVQQGNLLLYFVPVVVTIQLHIQLLFSYSLPFPECETMSLRSQALLSEEGYFCEEREHKSKAMINEVSNLILFWH